MAVIEGGTTAALQDVDSGFRASRLSVRPIESLAWVSVGTQSGAVTGVAAAGAVFSFRNLAANPVLIRRVGVGFIATTGFTAAQMMSFGLVAARAFTASDSGGTAIALTGSNGKHRTSMGVLTSVDCRVATTGALSAGTKTLDTNTLAQVGGYATTAAGVVIAPGAGNLFGHDPEDYPLVLATNEGFNIQNMAAMGAGGVGTVFVNFELAEAASF